MPSRNGIEVCVQPIGYGEKMPENNENPEAQLNELLVLAEQLQQQVEQLQEANEQLRAQLRLAEQQLLADATPLISFGEDTLRRTLNAKAIKEVALVEDGTRDLLTGSFKGNGTFAVTVDGSKVTEYLPPKEAMAAQKLVEARWEQALQPPE